MNRKTGARAPATTARPVRTSSKPVTRAKPGLPGNPNRSFSASAQTRMASPLESPPSRTPVSHPFLEGPLHEIELAHDTRRW